MTTPLPLSLPWPIRTLLTIIEPLFALNGAYLILTNPTSYLEMTHRTSLIPHTKVPDLLYTQLASGWIMFALLGAILLRNTRDRVVWRHTCLAMLGSDAFHIWSVIQGAGGLEGWLRVWEWTGGEWGVALGSWPFLFARVWVVWKTYTD